MCSRRDVFVCTHGIECVAILEIPGYARRLGRVVRHRQRGHLDGRITECRAGAEYVPAAGCGSRCACARQASSPQRLIGGRASHGEVCGRSARESGRCFVIPESLRRLRHRLDPHVDSASGRRSCSGGANSGRMRRDTWSGVDHPAAITAGKRRAKRECRHQRVKVLIADLGVRVPRRSTRSRPAWSCEGIRDPDPMNRGKDSIKDSDPLNRPLEPLNP